MLRACVSSKRDTNNAPWIIRVRSIAKTAPTVPSPPSTWRNNRVISAGNYSPPINSVTSVVAFICPCHSWCHFNGTYLNASQSRFSRSLSGFLDFQTNKCNKRLFQRAICLVLASIQTIKWLESGNYLPFIVSDWIQSSMAILIILLNSHLQTWQWSMEKRPTWSANFK